VVDFGRRSLYSHGKMVPGNDAQQLVGQLPATAKRTSHLCVIDREYFLLQHEKRFFAGPGLFQNVSIEFRKKPEENELADIMDQSSGKRLLWILKVKKSGDLHCRGGYSK